MKIVGEKQQGSTYRQLSIKYDIPIGTIATWVYSLKQDGALEIKPRGQGRNKDIDYKERYEILKKFQDFLATKEPKEKSKLYQ